MTPHSDAQRDELAAACLRALQCEEEEAEIPVPEAEPAEEGEEAVSSEPIETASGRSLKGSGRRKWIEAGCPDLPE